VNLLLLSGSVEQPTHAERVAIRANFCNIDCADGSPMFTAFLPKADEQGRFDEWMSLQVAAGSTHITFSPFAAYNVDGVPYMEPFNWLDQPQRFADLVRRVSEYQGANSKAVTPVLFLDDGGPDPLPRINRYWDAIADELRKSGVIDRCIVVPAWEPVDGDWTSAELSYGLKSVRLFFPESIMGCHFSPTRWVGSSNPTEPDDPWQGGESDFYKSYGGQFIDIAFYQAPADAVFTPVCDYNDESCWLSRWYDGVIRLGTGYHGWRIVNVCLSEGPAYSFIRNQSTPEQARAWATAGKALADSLGVTVSFMNGLPY